MTIYLGADHGGYLLKEEIKTWLINQNYQVIDEGADKLDPDDDYPLFAAKVAQNVALNLISCGILFCRSGAGMTIAANKIKGVRAVEAFSVIAAQHAKEHNNANVLALSADWLKSDQIKEIINAFLTTQYTQEERHNRRLKQIKDLEKN